jgi:hypothetical protein
LNTKPLPSPFSITTLPLVMFRLSMPSAFEVYLMHNISARCDQEPSTGTDIVVVVVTICKSSHKPHQSASANELQPVQSSLKLARKNAVGNCAV